MKLFVYNWVYNNQSTIYGHCLDTDGNYKLVTINNYFPSCYIKAEELPRSSVEILDAVYKQMVTSLDISTSHSFYQVYFRNMKDLNQFVFENRKNIFMHDINQLTVFLANINANHVGWIEIPTENTVIDNIKFLEENNPYPHPKIFIFDIEVQTSSTGMPKSHILADSIEMISVVTYHTMKQETQKKFILHKAGTPLQLSNCTEIICNNEIDIIYKFFDLIKSENPTVITGFNIFGFDIDYIISRLKLKLCEIPDISRGIPNQVHIVPIDWKSDAYGYNKYDKLVIGGRIILDMFLYFKRIKLDRYNLNFIANKYINETKNDMPFDIMNNAFKTNNIKILTEAAKYCIQDSALIMKLFDKVQMWIDVCEISKITVCTIEDIYTRGEQIKLLSQCIKECIKRNIVLQHQHEYRDWDKYEGAHVIEPHKGVYNKCTLLDFQSLYPSLIIAYNICPSTYLNKEIKTIDHFTISNKHRFRKNPIGMLPGMIKYLLEERKRVKQLMKQYDKSSITYTVYDRRQNALKICANSVYGMMGFKNSKYFGHLGCAESVTTLGRLHLSNVINAIKEKYSIPVIYGDTDSCMIWYDNSTMTKDQIIEHSYSICKYITSTLPNPMSLQFESYFDKVILLTKKRYILVNEKNISYKGVMNARRDYCKYAKETYEHIIQLIAIGESNENVINYINKQIFDLIMNKVNIKDLIITKSIAKDIKSYKVNQPHIVMAKRLTTETGKEVSAGTRLEFVYVEEFDSQGEKMRTIEEVQKNNFKIDSLFYISKQLCTQIDDILGVIGYTNYIKHNVLH